ncbi:hypothetical protein BG74_07135 [Sodalis-like endosymbiont of Proechinophthirus fluctus]|nr:hypothetical protein BG74_07135 [Sodalis-like endosymbiont of Proechinophthirus fluctus]
MHYLYRLRQFTIGVKQSAFISIWTLEHAAVVKLPVFPTHPSRLLSYMVANRFMEIEISIDLKRLYLGIDITSL